MIVRLVADPSCRVTPQKVVMHSKQSGSLGALKVAADLIACGHAVLTELGDLSKVGLIALVDHHPVKIQVKARTSKHGTVEVSKRKSGPNYQFVYQEEEVDLRSMSSTKISVYTSMPLNF